jgi:hypothetical protein
LRLEQDADNANNNTSTSKPNIVPKTKGPITKLNGTAPYGIEKRPMPTGVDLDKLLPKQVGPYARVALERSQQRGTTATSIEVDGNGVYATYRNVDKEIFVNRALPAVRNTLSRRRCRAMRTNVSIPLIRGLDPLAQSQAI